MYNAWEQCFCCFSIRCIIPFNLSDWKKNSPQVSQMLQMTSNNPKYCLTWVVRSISRVSLFPAILLQMVLLRFWQMQKQFVQVSKDCRIILGRRKAKTQRSYHKRWVTFAAKEQSLLFLSVQMMCQTEVLILLVLSLGFSQSVLHFAGCFGDFQRWFFVLKNKYQWRSRTLNKTWGFAWSLKSYRQVTTSLLKRHFLQLVLAFLLPVFGSPYFHNVIICDTRVKRKWLIMWLLFLHCDHQDEKLWRKCVKNPNLEIAYHHLSWDSETKRNFHLTFHQRNQTQKTHFISINHELDIYLDVLLCRKKRPTKLRKLYPKGQL